MNDDMNTREESRVAEEVQNITQRILAAGSAALARSVLRETLDLSLRNSSKVRCDESKWRA